MSKSPARKLEEWVAEALSSITDTAEDLAVELASTSDETNQIRRIIIDATSNGFVDGSIPSDGDRIATVRVLYNTSAERVAAETHDTFSASIEELLGDKATMRTAATQIADFYLYFTPLVDTQPSQVGAQEDGSGVRQTAFTLTNVMFRDDDGTGT